MRPEIPASWIEAFAFLSLIRIGSERLKWKLTRLLGALGNAAIRLWVRNGHDAITGLPNRNSFLKHLDGEIAAAAGQRARFSLLYIRILNFPEINLLAGYETGDRLLKRISDKLVSQFGRRVAAITPGSFVVLLKPVDDEEDACRKARPLLDGMQQPLVIDGISLEPRCASGIAIFPEHGTTPLQLLRSAELAHSAGLQLRRPIIVYKGEHEPDSRHLSLMSAFSGALKRKEFRLLCQPKLELNSGRIIGGEILIRWQHPNFGELSPDDFIPLAEKTGFVKSITLHVLEEVVGFISARSGEALQFSVNVAAKDISDPDFGRRVSGIVGEHASSLVLEITETDAMEDRTQVLDTALQLNRAGILLSIDDFGTGFSSLSYLKELKPGEIKIDKLFIRDLLDSDADRALVRSTIQLAHDLGISVVAEGVEDDRTLQALVDMDCDKAQGFGISRPMPLEAFNEWYAARARPVDIPRIKRVK